MVLISDAGVSPGDFGRRLADQAAETAATRTARRGEHASVTAGQTRFAGEGGVLVAGGGDLNVEDGGSINVSDGGDINLSDGGSITIEGGQLVLKNPDGVQVAFFGDINLGGVISRGWVYRFDTGEAAFILGGEPGRQWWQLRDNAGNYVVTNDADSGHGLGRPYLNYSIVPAFAAESVGEGATSLWPSTASTTPTKLMQGINSVWNPRVTIGVATATIGGGSAEWRLDIGGQTAASSTDGSPQTVTIPEWGDEDGINPGDSPGFDLYAWAAGGATRAWVQCDRLHGTQS